MDVGQPQGPALQGPYLAESSPRGVSRVSRGRQYSSNRFVTRVRTRTDSRPINRCGDDDPSRSHDGASEGVGRWPPSDRKVP